MSEILNRIAQKHPLSHEHAEDGRYAWPDRWHEAHDEVDALEAELKVNRLALSLIFTLQPELGMHRLLQHITIELDTREHLEQDLAAAQQEKK